MVDEALMNILCCPWCKGELSRTECALVCYACNIMYGVVDGIPMFTTEEVQSHDVRINALKWKEFWESFDWEAGRAPYSRTNLPYIYRHLKPIRRGDLFLELGGGPSYLSFDLASKGIDTVSVDLDISVLQKAKRHFSRHGCGGHFVQASFYHLPFRKGVFSVSGGIGVLEHSCDIEIPVRELARVTEEHGYTFQTVPHLSTTTLLTGSLRFGTIPHFPVLRRVVPFVHVKLLKMKYMKYGYEESYTYGFLRRLFRDAGFQKVEVGFFDYNQTLYRRRKHLAPFFYRLLRVSLLGFEPFSDIAYARATR